MSLPAVLRFIATHPIGRRNRARAFWNLLAWQVTSRLSRGDHTVNWIPPAKLRARRGMSGASGNIYVGLHEFEEMGFLLHLLREADSFVDVGANVGSYTILASRVVGAKSISIEPVPATYAVLCENVRLNGIIDRVDLRNVGVASTEGELVFSVDLDTVNHVLTDEEKLRKTARLSVPVAPLSLIIGDRRPVLVKIDVEGFEAEVLKSGGDLWINRSLVAVIMELNGSGRRYGFDDEETDRLMKTLGFERFTYDPFRRALIHVELSEALGGNLIYVRDFDYAMSQLTSARSFSALGVSF